MIGTSSLQLEIERPFGKHYPEITTGLLRAKMTDTIRAIELRTKHPDEDLPMSVILSPALKSGELITAINAIEIIPDDSTLVINHEQVNTAEVTNTKGKVVGAIGKAVDFLVQGGMNRTLYYI